MIQEKYEGPNPEKLAAERGLAEMRAGKWKADKIDTYGLEDYMMICLDL